MPRYVVNDNAQNNGDHEVQTTDCVYYPQIKSSTPLGLHASCGPAKTAAKKIYAKSDGCATCCPDCHTS
ncbi:MAG: hypothetical protein E2O92_04315 [Alphaproteobacteria bacterium]|nr:MAG: hypothetical protein E2O92_04315 [Alphaproteobacteria bacterium]